MLTRLGLFDAKELENRVHYKFISICLCSCFWRDFFVLGCIEYEKFLNIDEILTDTTIPTKTGPRNSEMKRYSKLIRTGTSPSNIV